MQSLCSSSLGPYGANIFDPRSWGDGNRDTINTITLEVTRVVLAIGVFAIGVELPKAYMQRHWKSLLFLLAPVMTYVRPSASFFCCCAVDLDVCHDAHRAGLSRPLSYMRSSLALTSSLLWRSQPASLQQTLSSLRQSSEASMQTNTFPRICGTYSLRRVGVMTARRIPSCGSRSISPWINLPAEPYQTGFYFFGFVRGSILFIYVQMDTHLHCRSSHPWHRVWCLYRIWLPLLNEVL